MIDKFGRKIYAVTINGKETFHVTAWDEDDAACRAYRLFTRGEVTVHGDILWLLGCTKDSLTIREIVNDR